MVMEMWLPFSDEIAIGEACIYIHVQVFLLLHAQTRAYVFGQLVAGAICLFCYILIINVYVSR